MIAANANYDSDDEFEPEIEKLEIEITDALNWKEELQSDITILDGIIEENRAKIGELKRHSPSRFRWMTAKSALLIVMRENKSLHWRQAHKLVQAGGCYVYAATIRVYLSTDWRYGNDWGSGYYVLLC